MSTGLVCLSRGIAPVSELLVCMLDEQAGNDGARVTKAYCECGICDARGPRIVLRLRECCCWQLWQDAGPMQTIGGPDGDGWMTVDNRADAAAAGQLAPGDSADGFSFGMTAC